jgi:cytochrome c oxidase assembly protein Cox11
MTIVVLNVKDKKNMSEVFRISMKSFYQSEYNAATEMVNDYFTSTPSFCFTETKLFIHVVLTISEI